MTLFVLRALRRITFASFAPLSAGLLLMLNGCAALMAPPAPPPPPPMTRLAWRIPSFTPTAESPSTQAKEALSITVTPVLYQKQTRETHADQVLGRNAVGSVLYCRTFTPAAFVAPSRIAFTATVVNGLNRVFRSAGAVISLNVDGTSIGFESTGVKEFLDVVLTPRGQAQVTIWGPPLSVLRSSGTIALDIFDIVTAMDAAGNATKKQNFSWVMTYSLADQYEAAPLRGQTLVTPPGGGAAQPAQVAGARCPV